MQNIIGKLKAWFKGNPVVSLKDIKDVVSTSRYSQEL